MQNFATAPKQRQMRDLFGFDGSLLTEAVVARASAVSLSYVGGLYPLGAPGMIRWIHSVAALREALAPYGYELDEAGQQSRVIHSGRRLAIVALAGNQWTGLPRSLTRRSPSTRWPKGERLAQAVSVNAQLTIDGFDEEPAGPTSPIQLETWILLQHSAGDEVRSELSCPAEISASGHVSSWRAYFILPPVATAGGPADQPFGDNDDGEIDISIEPR